MGILLGLAAALLYGSSDFGGGLLSRRLGLVRVTVIGSAAAGGASHDGAGPALVVSILITAIGCGFCALCYAEFASMIPVAGSAYTYSYATLGEFVAWIIGWDLVLEYALAGTTVAIGWSGYVVSLLHRFGIHIPPQFTASQTEMAIE